MTNHSETTGPFENGDIARRELLGEESAESAHDTQVTLRTPAELADALPYLLGYRPEDSIVLVALHDRAGRGRFGGRARLGIPASEEDWDDAARQLTQGFVATSERRGNRPQRLIAFFCQEPSRGETGRDVMLRLAPLADAVRAKCSDLDIPVIESLCIADGRFWSYSCRADGCCPDDGTPMGLPGTSVLAAAATYAGIQVRGTLRELRARLLPWETGAALDQEVALDSAGMALVPRILDDTARAAVAEETIELAERIIGTFAAAPPVSGAHPADLRDDELLAHDEAATLILGLQDRTTRDRAAAWMEGDEAGPALRLWRALARRCVGSYREHAAAPLTLAGWVAWSTGDELEAREAFAMALGADPDYLFARLLHQACNEGLDPESIRRCLRAEREGRAPEDSGEEEARDEPSTITGEDPGTVTRAQGRSAPRPADVTRSRRRRRTRASQAGDAGLRRSRGDDGRSLPAGSPPQPPAAGPSRPGSVRQSGTRTRAGDDMSGGAAAAGGRRETEGDG
ncbi:DUF4192 domain-containing protein [Streptomyces bungoensis]|uniref:DUF4192 domain-containing protein n=1 Tax=Streptomyces bungoensis TaxID=285568 RepID=UPI0036D1F211